MNKDKRTAIFQRWQQANPAPTTELEFRNEFELLIAVILSAQATDKSVNIATRTLFEAAPDAASMHTLGVDGIKSHIKSIGLFNAKAENIYKTCGMLVERHGGEVPQNRDELEALPGVGRKTANVILNTAFGQETMAVDTHIFRVANRTRIAKGKNVRVVEERLLRLIPKPFRLHAHHWLILHGRYTCLARKPKCPSCLIKDLCEYDAKVSDDD